MLSRAHFSVLAAAAIATGCLSIPDSVPDARAWTVERVPPRPLAGPVNVPLDRRASDAGYELVLSTSVAGLDYTNTETFVESLTKQPDGKGTDGVGHSWVLLVGPDERIECGHSGEYGKSQPVYFDGVLALMRAGDPNPARYLWVEMTDGIRLDGSGGRAPSYRCRVPITRAQHDAIRAFIDSFDYSVFALRGKGCTDFVVQAAALAQLSLPNRVRVRLPPELRYAGSTHTLWTDPQYGSIVFGSPEVLEDGLRELVATGVARAR